MAVSKTGGTKGKLRGQVGTTIYQVRRNDDGTYTQILYQKGERVETQTSPKLQAQRMYTAMVESLMKQLKPVGRISMQSGKNKSQSLNAFSSWNLRFVANDAKAHWYGNQQFVYPRHHRTDINVQDLGGPYVISSGTLDHNIYDREVFDNYAAATWLNPTFRDGFVFGVQFTCEIGVTSVGQFFKAHRMTRLDKIVMAGFHDWIDYDEDPDDPQEYMKHSYFIASVNYSIRDEEIMTPEVIRNLLKFESDMSPVILMARDGHSFCVGVNTDYQGKDDQFYYVAYFSISYPRGKKEISSSEYHNPEGGAEPWLWNQHPSYVFGSWMGDPTNPNYPSPYE